MKRAVLIAGLMVAFATPAFAKGAKHAAADKGKRASASASSTSTTTTATTSTTMSTSTEDEKEATPAANTKIKTKTYTFGAMDVEGKLKTPQLLYFLNRMKSEFDTTTPDKRSFIPELKRSTDEM